MNSHTRTVTSAAVALLALALGGCGDPPAGDSDDAAGTPAVPTLVEVSVDDGAGDVQAFTLSCGDQPAFTAGEAGERDAAEACAALDAAHDRLVTLSDPDREPEMCTEIYGGPETATIRGTVRDDAVDAEVARNNGCGIADWDGLEPLLGPPARGEAEPVG